MATNLILAISFGFKLNSNLKYVFFKKYKLLICVDSNISSGTQEQFRISKIAASWLSSCVCKCEIGYS